MLIDATQKHKETIQLHELSHSKHRRISCFRHEDTSEPDADFPCIEST